MATIFEQTYKLSNVIYTIPATTDAVEQSFPALRRMKAYLRSTQNQAILSQVSLLLIEKALTAEVKKTSNFHDVVI
jgi:hypothetical protein